MANNHETPQETLHNKTYGDEKRWPGWINKAGNNTKPWIMTRNRTSDPHIHKTNNKTQQQQRWPGWLQGRALNKNIKSKSWLASFIGTSDLPKTTRQHQVWILNGFVYRNLRYTPTNNNIKSKSWLASFIGTSDLLTTSKCEFWLASFIGTSNSLATQPKIFNIATHHKNDAKTSRDQTPNMTTHLSEES